MAHQTLWLHNIRALFRASASSLFVFVFGQLSSTKHCNQEMLQCMWWCEHTYHPIMRLYDIPISSDCETLLGVRYNHRRLACSRRKDACKDEAQDAGTQERVKTLRKILTSSLRRYLSSRHDFASSTAARFSWPARNLDELFMQK